MSEKNKREIEDLKAKIKALTSLNIQALYIRLLKLKPYELEQLANGMNKYVDSTIKKLDELENGCTNLVASMEEIEDIKKQLDQKKKSSMFFRRYYGVATKHITVSNFYAEPLIESLKELCDIHISNLIEEYSNKSLQDRFEEVKEYIATIPVTFTDKMADKYDDADEYLDALLSEKNNKQHKEIKELRDAMDKIKDMRYYGLLTSSIISIALFIGYLIAIGDENNPLFTILFIILLFFVFKFTYKAILEVYIKRKLK